MRASFGRIFFLFVRLTNHLSKQFKTLKNNNIIKSFSFPSRLLTWNEIRIQSWFKSNSSVCIVCLTLLFISSRFILFFFIFLLFSSFLFLSLFHHLSFSLSLSPYVSCIEMCADNTLSLALASLSRIFLRYKKNKTTDIKCVVIVVEY